MQETNIEKIRALLDKNPDAGYKELEEIFGHVTRSIKVQFWNEYKKMFGRTYQSDNAIYLNVAKYFQEHPGKSVTDARRELPYTRKQIHAAIQRAKKNGIPVPCRKKYRQEWTGSDADKIRRYALQHPTTTCRECADALGVSYSNANSVLCELRKQDLISPTTYSKRIPGALVKECMDLLDAGYTVYHVSKTTGVSPGTIKRYYQKRKPKDKDRNDIYDDGTCGI